MTALTSNIKRLVATDKKYNEAPVFIVPKMDPKTRKVRDYIGRIPEELRSQVTVNLEPELNKDNTVVDELVIRTTHLMIFDLNNANEAVFFEVIKEDEMIAPSKDAVNPQVHRFYIEDKEKESTVLISKSKLKGQAFDVLGSLSMEQMTNYARILGKYVVNLSGTQIEAALYEIADKDPQLILNINSDKDLKYKIFLRKCVEKRIISLEAGKYMNGKDLIGINEDYAIHWLKDQANEALITQWSRMLKEGTQNTNDSGATGPGSMTS